MTRQWFNVVITVVFLILMIIEIHKDDAFTAGLYGIIVGLFFSALLYDVLESFYKKEKNDD